jgi:hypothetical protein
MKRERPRNFFKDRKRILIIPFLFLAVWPAGRALGETFQLVGKEFLWTSPNLIQTDSLQKNWTKLPRLGSLSFKNYFDRYGTHPSLPFLRPLKEKNVTIAQIEKGHILFRKTGKRVPLNRSLVPSWGNAVPPYLLATPNQKWIFVVYPYYVYQDKENRFVTEVYDAQGILLMTLESLPTHVSIQNPDLLISPEKTGCCESLKWTIRFYNLKEGSISEYGCPEGLCGDILFTKLGDKGPFMIAQEIVGKVAELGASMQTNVYMVENDGRLSASGKTLFVIREPNLDEKKLESLSPFAISSLVSIEPLPGKEGWILHFSKSGQGKVLRLASNYLESPPSPVFLLPKDPSMAGKKGIRIGEHPLERLPLLGVAEPGRISFEIPFGDGREEKVLKEIKSDFVNFLMF